MPKNTAAGVYIAGFAFVIGFAMIWHMFLIAGLAFLGLLVTAIGHTFNYKRDYYIPADVVARTEAARTEELAAHV
jgi:cytochrome o ubiquinol oxidase subunit 1